MSWKHRTIADEHRIIGLTNGHTQAQIAQEVGCSKAVVVDVQRKYHLVLSFGRSISSAQFRYAYDEHAWGRVIEELYIDQRLSLEETAARCEIDIGTLRRRMDTLGIPRRTAGESRRGKPRGPYRWSVQLPDCENEQCHRRVKDHGQRYCSACRRLARYRNQ